MSGDVPEKLVSEQSPYWHLMEATRLLLAARQQVTAFQQLALAQMARAHADIAHGLAFLAESDIE